MIVIEVPGIPPSPNELRRKYRNPHAYKRLRERWEHDLAYGLSGGAHQRKALTSESQTRRMAVQVTLYHARLFDADNLTGALKPVLDALVRIHYLKDDGPAWLHLLPTQQVQCPRKHARTVIRIGPADLNSQQ